MTEKSYFHDGTTFGDAEEAPYSAEIFSSIISALYGSGNNYVLGINNFYTTPVNLNCTIGAGYALIEGRFFEINSKVVAIPQNTSTYPRFDRIFIRLNKNNNTVRLVVVQGTPAASPTPPEPSSDSNIVDMPIWKIYVPAGVAALFSYNYLDERPIYIIPDGSSGTASRISSHENIMPNSEFLAGAGTSYDTAPAMWALVGGATCSLQEKFTGMNRGSSTEVVCTTAGDGIGITVPRLGTAGAAINYTLKILIEIISGEIEIFTTAGAPNPDAQIPATGNPFTVTIRTAFTNADKDMELSIISTTNVLTVFRLGQVTLSQSNIGVEFIPKKELIFFSTPITQTGYDTTTKISNGTYEIALESPIQEGISTLITQLEANDSNAAAATTLYAALQDIENNGNQLRLENGSAASNTAVVVGQGFIGIPSTTAGDQKFQLEISNNGDTGIYTGIYHLGVIT